MPRVTDALRRAGRRVGEALKSRPGVRIVKHLIDAAKGKHPLRVRRSPEWPRIEREYKAAHPACEVCGSKDHIQVHHKQPFHLYPERELDPDNLMSLCEPPGKTRKCHLIFGHVFDFHLFNPNLAQDAQYWKQKLIEANQRRKAEH